MFLFQKQPKRLKKIEEFSLYFASASSFSLRDFTEIKLKGSTH